MVSFGEKAVGRSYVITTVTMTTEITIKLKLHADLAFYELFCQIWPIFSFLFFSWWLRWLEIPIKLKVIASLVLFWPFLVKFGLCIFSLFSVDDYDDNSDPNKVEVPCSFGLMFGISFSIFLVWVAKSWPSFLKIIHIFPILEKNIF